MSSLEARPKYYISSDYQLLSTSHSYEASKYQIDLLATQLDLKSQKGDDDPKIRHFITQPGISCTNIDTALIGVVQQIFKILVFYLVRSPHLSLAIVV
jgi:3-keto steroid reductase